MEVLKQAIQSVLLMEVPHIGLLLICRRLNTFMPWKFRKFILHIVYI
ncbi:MAG: hypothetical protein RHS_0800 [Robinsoniella sp. RHS]|nr:MAG: hypothetical protein RHS_0800 [Robinsoniella sp. RHS]